MIDFHSHQPSSADTWGLQTYGADDYLTFMDEVGITHSVVFTLDGLMDPGPERNDSLASFVSTNPTRLIPFGTVNPRRRDALAEVDRCFKDLGMRGLKFHPWLQGFCPHEPFMDAICDLAASYGVPVLFHDGTPPYSSPLQISVLAQRHPELPIVLGHGGLHDLWREAVAAVVSTDNLYICMSGPPIFAMREIVRSCPIDRILFGTDAGISSQADQPYVRTRLKCLNAIGLSAEARDAMCDINPRRLLRIS